MARRRISQREAIRTRKALREALAQLEAIQGYPNGRTVCQIEMGSDTSARLNTARVFASTLLLFHRHGNTYEVVATNVQSVTP